MAIGNTRPSARIGTRVRVLTGAAAGRVGVIAGVDAGRRSITACCSSRRCISPPWDTSRACGGRRWTWRSYRSRLAARGSDMGYFRFQKRVSIIPVLVAAPCRPDWVATDGSGLTEYL